MLTYSVVLGAVAVVYWLARGQSARKGLGFTINLWSLGDLAAGVVISLIAMLGIFLIELALGAIRVTGTPFDFSVLLETEALPLMLFGAFFEELIFRALLLSGIAAVLGLLLSAYKRLSRVPGDLKWLEGGARWAAILISAALFGIAHLKNPNATYISVFGNALGGLMYGIAFLGGRNLWLPMGLHFGWNFFQGPVLGFPVSGIAHPSLIMQQALGADLITGGAYGPEAGLVGILFRFVVIALVLWYLNRRANRRGNFTLLDFPIAIYDNPTREQKRRREPSLSPASTH